MLTRDGPLVTRADLRPRLPRLEARLGVFCLEGHWWGVKGKTTVEPVLRLLETSGPAAQSTSTVVS